MKCERCLVSGRVQGVWFRGSAQQHALRLSITGFARNLPDGRVEVLACGSEAAVAQMKQWLWQGPPLAHVDEVICQSVNETPPDGFTTK